MIALTNLFIHDAHEPSMTAASDILRKPACISRQEAPTLTEGAGTCRTEDGDPNNGASSAGKSTLARNLRLLLKEEAMIFSMDDYLAMSQGKHETALDAVRESGLPFIESFHAAIAEAARKGALVIVDHVIGESPHWIQDLLNRLDGIPRILVRVECRQDVLLERERRRTDRTPAPAHAPRQHAGLPRHFPHDFSIDTSEDAPRKCAMRLISLLPGEFLP